MKDDMRKELDEAVAKAKAEYHAARDEEFRIAKARTLAEAKAARETKDAKRETRAAKRAASEAKRAKKRAEKRAAELPENMTCPVCCCVKPKPTQWVVGYYVDLQLTLCTLMICRKCYIRLQRGWSVEHLRKDMGN